MSWGTHYKYTGYLSRIGKDAISDKREELERINELMWQEILAYMASTPPASQRDAEGNEYPWQEFIVMKVRRYREELEDNIRLLERLDNCEEAIEDDPENVTEG